MRLFFEWTVRKELVQKKGGAEYIVSPWALTWDDENYYMVGVVIDRFGTDVMIHPHDQEHFHAGVTIPLYQREALWKGITDCYFEKLSTDDREKCLALIDFYTLFLILMEVVEMCRDVRNDPEALADRKQVFEKLLNLLREQDFESLKGAFDLWNV